MKSGSDEGSKRCEAEDQFKVFLFCLAVSVFFFCFPESMAKGSSAGFT